MKLFIKHKDRKPEPQPEQVNIKRVLLIGNFVWLIAIVILAAFYQPLADAGLLWWLHTAILGLALGVLGYFTVRT